MNMRNLGIAFFLGICGTVGCAVGMTLGGHELAPAQLFYAGMAVATGAWFRGVLGAKNDRTS